MEPRERARKWYWDNRERALANRRKYREEHLEEEKFKHKLYRKNNAFKVHDANVIYYERNILQLRSQSRIKSLNKGKNYKGLGNKLRYISLEDIAGVYDHNKAEWNGVLTCYLCGIPILEGDPDLKSNVGAQDSSRS